MMKLTIIVFLLFITMLSFTSCNKNEKPENPEPPDPIVKKYTNPVFNPVFADPTLLDNRNRDGYFYAYATQDNWGTSNATERIVPILRSTDLISWEDMGDAFDSQPNWNIGQNLVWAPDVKYRDGKYYMYYSLSVWGGSNPALGVAVCDTPDGKFTDLGKILDSNDSGVPNSIDPYFFTDTDGQSYIFWGSFHGIYGVSIEADGITAKIDEKFRIAGNAFEAPYIFIKDGYYYYLGSVGSCCDGPYTSYHVTVARSESLEGPYLDRNGDDIKGIMDSNLYGKTSETINVNVLSEGENIIGPGHNSEIIQDDEGQDWILYHGIIKPNYNLPNGATRRPLFLDKVIWDSEGWPKIGINGTPSEYETDVPVFNE